MLAGSANNQRADDGIVGKTFQRGGHPTQHVLVVGVGHFRTVQHEGRDTAGIGGEPEGTRTHGAAIAAGSALAPHTTTPTLAPEGGVNAPHSNAASAVAPPGSAIRRVRSQISRCAAAIAASGTSTAAATCACAMGNIRLPT